MEGAQQHKATYDIDKPDEQPATSTKKANILETIPNWKDD